MKDSDAPAVSERFRNGMEHGDIDRVLSTLAHDVVLRSPFTDRLTFNGQDEMRRLLAHVFGTIRDIRYFVDVGDARTRALFYRARVKGQLLEEATRLRLNDDGLIQEITLSFRPVPGVMTLMAVLAPGMARDRGRFRAIIARLLLAPLASATRLGDRLVTKFV